MTIAYSWASYPSLSYNLVVGVGTSNWYSSAICGVELLSEQNDSAASVTVKIKKSNATSLGSAKLIARLYKAKPHPANYPQPLGWDNSNDPNKFGLAQSAPVLLEGLISDSAYTDVTFQFTSPLVAESNYNGRYVVVIMPAFEYTQSYEAAVNPDNRASAGFPTDSFVFIEGTRDTSYSLGQPGFNFCMTYNSNSGSSPNQYDRMVLQIDGVPSNTAPTDISLSSASIAENAAANATVGTLSATDAEGGAMSWALVAGAGDTDNGSFEIVGDELRLANGVSLDYEAKSSYSVRVQATDAGDLTYAQALTISVTNLNEAPSNITLSASSIQEGNAIGDVVGTLAAIDPDTGDSAFTFSLVSGGDKFSIEGGSLKAAAVFDYEVATSHSVTVRATDAGGAAFDKVFTISVVNDSSDDPQAVEGSAVVSGTGGKVALVSANNPTVAELTLEGAALPVGSVVRWSGNSNQKFFKISGNAKAFKAIPLTPPVSWKWSAAGDDAWEVLQGF